MLGTDNQNKDFDYQETKQSSNEDDVQIENIRMTEFQILKNVTIISFVFLFLFTAFQALANLQSTLNEEEGLGTGGMAIIYASLIVSCLLLPVFIIARLGCKWTISVSIVGYILYMAANFHAVWGLIAPASVIIGLAAAPLWSAKCTYLTNLAIWYAKLKGITEDAAINRFFGMFFMAFQSAQIWGNLFSSLVFKRELRNETEVTEEILDTCGASFFPAAFSNNTNMDRPEIGKVYTLLGIYLGCAVLAFLLSAVFLDKITVDVDPERNKKKTDTTSKLLIEIVKHLWRSTPQKLLVPLTIYSGLQQVFITADFTKSFISCALGIDKVGFIMICYGVTDSICSSLFGRLVQFAGHAPFFFLAFLLHGGCQIALLVWKPDPEAKALFYIFAAIWGMGDAVIQTQINALYGYLFTSNKEAAFANYRLWESIGFLMAFSYSNFFYTSTKIYVGLAWLVVGMAGYTIVEIRDRQNKSRSLSYVPTVSA